MDVLFAAACAALLAIERLVYWFAWTRPQRFRKWVRGTSVLPYDDPVQALRALFYAFKCIQAAVLLAWCSWFAEHAIPLPTAPLPFLAMGVLLILFGQVLNFSVMGRLGTEGVFYGNRFGRDVEWQTGFPFSLYPHPQYLGALLSVWGFMLAMRYPNPDWIVLPVISTVYYALGARLES